MVNVLKTQPCILSHMTYYSMAPQGRPGRRPGENGPQTESVGGGPPETAGRMTFKPFLQSGVTDRPNLGPVSPRCSLDRHARLSITRTVAGA